MHIHTHTYLHSLLYTERLTQLICITPLNDVYTLSMALGSAPFRRSSSTTTHSWLLHAQYKASLPSYVEDEITNNLSIYKSICHIYLSYLCKHLDHPTLKKK